jgi:hypothetical protein
MALRFAQNFLLVNPSLKASTCLLLSILYPSFSTEGFIFNLALSEAWLEGCVQVFYLLLFFGSFLSTSQ